MQMLSPEICPDKKLDEKTVCPGNPFSEKSSQFVKPIQREISVCCLGAIVLVGPFYTPAGPYLSLTRQGQISS